MNYTITIEFDHKLNDFKVTSRDFDSIVESSRGYAKSLEDVHAMVEDFAMEMSND